MFSWEILQQQIIKSNPRELSEGRLDQEAFFFFQMGPREKLEIPQV